MKIRDLINNLKANFPKARIKIDGRLLTPKQYLKVTDPEEPVALFKGLIVIAGGEA